MDLVYKQYKEQMRQKELAAAANNVFVSMFVCFILMSNYKNKAIQRRGVEANDVIALQKNRKTGLYLKKIKQVLLQGMLHLNSVNLFTNHSTKKCIGNSLCGALQLQLNLVIAS